MVDEAKLKAVSQKSNIDNWEHNLWSAIGNQKSPHELDHSFEGDLAETCKCNCHGECNPRGCNPGLPGRSGGKHKCFAKVIQINFFNTYQYEKTFYII